MIERHYKANRIEVIIDDIEEFEELLVIKKASVRKNSSAIYGTAIYETLHAFAGSVLADLEHSQQLRYLRLLKEFGTANFTFVMRVGETFSIPVDGDTFELTGASKTDYIDTDTWQTAFYSAIILRDREAISSLNEVDETLFFKANLKCDEFDIALVRLLQNLFVPNVDIAMLLETALKADDIDRGRLPYANKILLPLLPIYRCIFTAEAEGDYNDAMRDAVKKHKAFWKKDNYETEGWIALPLIAAAAFAYDYKGYQLDFETDYIPNWLVKGEFDKG